MENPFCKLHLSKIFLSGLMFISFQSESQYLPAPYTNVPSSPNLVRSYTVLKPGLTKSEIISPQRTPLEVVVSTEYYDGLGRPLQTVLKNGSFNTSNAANTGYNDVVSLKEYDDFGRELYQFLPFPLSGNNGGNFVSQNPFQQQADFYNNLNVEINPIGNQGEKYFYGETDVQPVPLSRAEWQFAPGNHWVGTKNTTSVGIRTGYFYNTITDSVRIWLVNDNAQLGVFGTYTSPGYYTKGQLFKIITTDEHGKQIIEFKDKQGQVILKKVQLTAEGDSGSGKGYTGWICTYYIYDDFGSLRCVIQPEGVKWLTANKWNLASAQLLAEQCFRYEYDYQRRMIIKKVPGAAEVAMVYDARDRLVATQDGNLRAKKQWLYTWYDALNRPCATGIWTVSTETGNVVQRWQARANEAAPIITEYPSVITAGREELTFTFYDDYGWLNQYTGHGLNENLESAATLNDSNPQSFPYAEARTKNVLTKGMVTGSRVKILGTSFWITTLNLYDEKGRVIQSKSHNADGQVTELVSTQYGFAGQVMATEHRQRLNAGTKQTLLVSTKSTFDELGRNNGVTKRLGHTYSSTSIPTLSAEKKIFDIKYDPLGQVKIKNIGEKPGSPSEPLETLQYDYNIRGWLLGANRNFVKESTNLFTAGGWFGFDLGYDNTDAPTAGTNYTQAQFNGNISGSSWRSAGDQVVRKFDYSYDAANRLMKGLFTQKTGTGWSDQDMNFKVLMGDGENSSSAYDLNGNILKMQQWGWTPEGNKQIDELVYHYYLSSTVTTNRLRNVIDRQNDPVKNTGDFKTTLLHPQYALKQDPETDPKTITDYTYDVNGNLTKDLNKNIGTGSKTAITYNHLNLPVKITIQKDATTIKGIISYFYDATGNKIKKVVVENNVELQTNGNTYISNITTTTYYWGGSVYETKAYSNTALKKLLPYTTQLQFFGQEEGRVRALRPTPKSNHTGLVYDYMLKDHLGNVRMVLTEEEQIIRYPATTFEGTVGEGANSLVNYEAGFYKMDPANIVAETSIASWGNETGTSKDYFNHNGNPPANDMYPVAAAPVTTARSQKLYRLNATTNKTGLEFMIKVMAGDKIDIFGKSYYHNTTPVTNQNSSPLDAAALLTALLATPVNGIAAKGINPSQLSGINNSLIPSTFFRGSNNEDPTTTPKAYLNYMLFDEQFKFVSGNFSRVGTSGNIKDHWYEDPQLQNIVIPKNGYIFVYVSNESNLDVFFDNIQVIHKPGPMVEETHYYPFGLTMQGISSKAAGKTGNRHKYNGKEEQRQEFSDGSGLEWLDYGARMYDVQIGRWSVVDPMTHLFQRTSVYAYCSNNPIVKVDVEGKWDIEIHAYLNRGQSPYGLALLKDKSGQTLFSFIVKLEGSSSHKQRRNGVLAEGMKSRTQKNGDTPNGLYKIGYNLEGNQINWNSSNTKSEVKSYGPNKRLLLYGVIGEIMFASKERQTTIRLHGGRQEKGTKLKDQIDEYLAYTNGCIRAKDEDMAEIFRITNELEENDEKESGGYLRVIDDNLMGFNHKNDYYNNSISIFYILILNRYGSLKNFERSLYKEQKILGEMKSAGKLKNK